MRIRVMLAFFAVLAVAFATTGSQAISEDFVGLFEQRDLQVYKPIPGGSLGLAYSSYRSLEVEGPLPGAPSIDSSPDEEHIYGYFYASVPGTFLYADQVSPLSPGLPADPLLAGGARTLQYIITNAGTPACIGTTATLTLQLTGVGLHTVGESATQRIGSEDLDFVQVSAGGYAYRFAQVSGTLSSCLGSIPLPATPIDYATMGNSAGVFVEAD